LFVFILFQVNLLQADGIMARHKGHQPLLIVVGRIAPAEDDLAVDEADEPKVGDGHSMGVAAQVTQRILRPAKRGFS